MLLKKDSILKLIRYSIKRLRCYKPFDKDFFIKKESNMRKKIAVYWFRQDLRLLDNPALTAATLEAYDVLPIYILDDENAGNYAMGAASRVWLYHSLATLNDSLAGNLSLYYGNPKDIFTDLLSRFDVKAIHWNRCYEPWRMERDEMIKKQLKAKGIKVESHNGTLLWEPWTIKKGDGSPFKVFTPFFRNGCLKSATPRKPIPKLASISTIRDTHKSLNLNDLNLLPKIRWDMPMITHWDMSEEGGLKSLQTFMDEGIQFYKEGRDFPAKKYVSGLSPYLHFGQVSPHTLWYAIRAIGDNRNIESFCSELGWREFSYYLLYHHHDLPFKNIQSKFDSFPWLNNEKLLTAWQKGQTGIPMVDAGMRELWETGYMHNRVRMIVGSFLIKNLLLDWRHGERWFWDCLFDADLANNSASWQWVAGCGADAAPYFRIFNPVTQGQKFDPNGSYIRQYIPELKDLSDKYIHAPWEAPDMVLRHANVQLGKTYPNPIVDLGLSRKRALEAFKSLK